jgi:SAM-dependent methyltransferase
MLGSVSGAIRPSQVLHANPEDLPSIAVMTVTLTNRKIWDRVYEGGSLLWYPSEIMVRLVRRREHEGGFAGTVLDHGCGSGNGAEFLVRCGYNVHCTDISPAALKVVEKRFVSAGLTPPSASLIDPDRPLKSQLPKYDHVIAWQSLCYSDLASARRNLEELIDGLPAGGALIVNFPSPNDALYRHSTPMPDGSRRLVDDVSAQAGAIVTVPASPEELASWCAGIEVRDIALYGMTVGGRQSDYYVLYGAKR